MNSRTRVLDEVRRALGRAGTDPTTAAELLQQLRARPASIRPALAEAPVALFCTQAQRAGATLAEVDSAAQVPVAVQAYLAAGGRGTALVAGADPWLQALPWGATGLAIDWRSARATDAVALAHAPLAVAETGSLVLRSGTATPTTSNFLPETHVVVLEAGAIVAHLEDAWAALRAEGLPRSVNLITGPSRTADIEQTLQLGAHGPRWLHIVLVHRG